MFGILKLKVVCAILKSLGPRRKTLKELAALETSIAAVG